MHYKNRLLDAMGELFEKDGIYVVNAAEKNLYLYILNAKQLKHVLQKINDGKLNKEICSAIEQLEDQRFGFGGSKCSLNAKDDLMLSLHSVDDELIEISNYKSYFGKTLEADNVV